MKTLDCQSSQTALSQAQSKRSAGVSFGRLTERCRTLSCWRSARISRGSAARLRKEAKNAVRRADNRCPKGKSKEKGQLPVYQTDRILRKPQTLEIFGFKLHRSKPRRISAFEYFGYTGPYSGTDWEAGAGHRRGCEARCSLAGPVLSLNRVRLERRTPALLPVFLRCVAQRAPERPRYGARDRDYSASPWITNAASDSAYFCEGSSFFTRNR
jgi:hypothetical protein